MRRLPLPLLLVLFLIIPVRAQSSSALINAELDKNVQLDIKNQPLPQAVKIIEDKSNGVRIDVAPQVWDLLPWGEQTTINAKIENKTLRDALAAITRKLGLTFELKDEAVEIQPLPALKRLGRRATVDELAVLDFLSRTPYEGKPQLTVRGLLEAVDAKLESSKSNFAVENRAGGADGTSVPVKRDATLLEALDAIPLNTDATWYPWGKSLVVMQKVDQVRGQLANKTVTIRFNGVNVSQVLAELQSRSGVKFTIEPGAVARLSPEQQNVRLVLENASIEQALENLAGFTGLAWIANDKGVYISNPSAGAAVREPSVAMITLDNGVQVVVRESQVPSDVREYIKFKTDEKLAKIRQMMKDEGFKPSTKPATAPSTRRSDDL